MEKETERIAAIVRRVRDSYRPVSQERQRTDLDAAADKVLELTSEQLQRYGIAVEREKAFSQAGKLMLYVNPDDLEQVLLNLVLNAIDAMAQHGGTLRVSTALDKVQSPEGGPRPAARIQISDTGAGISPDMLPHIFEPFVTTRADQSTPPVPKTALGLSINYSIVQAYGGEITASSQVGVGTTFTVLLPL
jgi:signal transduction histidine kinase